jgi:hypothetical protein
VRVLILASRCALLSWLAVDAAASSAFLAASNDPNCLFLKYSIVPPAFACVHRGLTPSSAAYSSTSVAANFTAISRGIAEGPGGADSACYIVSRNVSSEQGKWLLIFYMPDGCTVRDRMIYAASTAALKDGLGTGNFTSNTFSIGSLAECTAAEYANSTRTMEDADLLTLDEKEKLASEAESHRAMATTKSQAIAGLPIHADEEALKCLKNMHAANGSVTSAIFRLHEATEVVQLQQQGKFTFEQIQQMLPVRAHADRPRFEAASGGRCGTGSDAERVLMSARASVHCS